MSIKGFFFVLPTLLLITEGKVNEFFAKDSPDLSIYTRFLNELNERICLKIKAFFTLSDRFIYFHNLIF